MEVNPQPPPLVPSAVAQDKLSELGCWYSALLQQPHSLDTVYECVYGRLRVHFCACSLLCVRAHESVIPLCLHVWVGVSQFFVCVARFNLSPPPPLLLYNPISAGIKIWLWRALKQQSALSTGRNSSRLRATDTNTQTHTFRSSAPGLMVVPGAKRWITND